MRFECQESGQSIAMISNKRETHDRLSQTVNGFLFRLAREVLGSGLGVGLSWSVQDQLAFGFDSDLRRTLSVMSKKSPSCYEPEE